MINFEYTIIRKSYRRTSTIRISDDNVVTVTVPKSYTKKTVLEFLGENAAWVRERIDFNTKYRLQYPPHQFVNGEALPYLGKKLTLKLKPGLEKRVELKGRCLCVHLPLVFDLDLSKQLASEQVIKWYKQEAGEILPQRVHVFAEHLGVLPKVLRLKTYKSQWGCCSHDGEIDLNWKLVMGPLPIIDYVVAHEICHMFHHNHSRCFWKKIESAVPNYRDRRKWLRDNESWFEL